MPPSTHPQARSKPLLNMDSDPASWLNFSLPPRARSGAGVPGSGVPGPPRRSRKGGEGWRGGALSREKYLNASFKFVLKPSEALSYGAHFADPDISLHWPNILQILVPTFSALSVAQGYVSEPHAENGYKSHDLEEMGEEAAERRRRMEEEKRGRMCPICLGKPVAGRMTKCGHIFCFPCILHYIQLSDIPKSAKCPICGDMVQSNALKSVKYLDAEAMLESSTHAANDAFEASLEEAKRLDSGDRHDKRHRLHMRLIQRPQMTTLALPSSSTWPSDAVPPHTAPWYFLPDIITYSRYMLATPEYMGKELEREMTELRREWELLRGDELGRVFVKAAMDKVERQMNKVKEELETELVRRSERKGREAWGSAVGGDKKEKEQQRERERKEQERIEREKQQDIGPVPVEFLANQRTAFDNSANINIPPNLPVEPNPMPPLPRDKKSRRRLNPAPPPQSVPPAPSYYFYQSSLGANVFLHPLDIRMLLAHYGSYNLFPSSMTFETTGYDPGTINDDLRKRCKYLSHLPLGSEVVFVETNLADLVSSTILAQFEQPLKARRQKRRDKVRKENRAKQKWEKAERSKTVEELQSVRSVPSAFVRGGLEEDRELELALARSAVEFEQNFPVAYPQPGMASSPPRSGAWDQTPIQTQSQSQQDQQRSFATALHQRYDPSLSRSRREVDPEVDALWQQFESMDVHLDPGVGADPGARTETGAGAGVRESERGGGRKKKEKGKKLILGGGGRRA
ncbi:alkylbase DNA N-glycosylase [Cryptococcus neoformans var. grubii Br795]|nr:alkylbase DNA N-glycosylase [Cryptococcus neoformans var. grubii Br795]